jgi:hypothetical protein
MKARDDIVNVAHLIANGTPAKWLVKALQDLTANVGRDIRNTEFISRPIDVRSDVEKLKKRALQFEKALNNISKRLLDLHSEGIADIPLARDAAHKMILLCDATLRLTDVKRGAPKEPGKVICSIIVIEAWVAVRGRAPSANNERAQEACEKYWIGCGCEPIGKDNPANWKRSIETARRDRTSRRWRWIGEEIRRRAEGTQ